MNHALSRLAAETGLLEPANAPLRLAFGLACVSRVEHLLEDARALAAVAVLRKVVAGEADAAALSSAAEEMAQVANSHRGSNSIDGAAHAAVSATYALANALAGRPLDAASYAAYAAVYAYGGYAVNDPASFEPEFGWQVEQLRRLASDATADRALVTSRLIDAPRERVFRAVSDPAQLARWWGPKGFSSTFAEFDLRPGGFWRFVMHGPDGTDYPNESVFVEVVAPERVVFEHLSDHHFVMTITFAAQGEQTMVGWRQVFDTAEHRERIQKFVTEANEQNIDRLAAQVRYVA